MTERPPRDVKTLGENPHLAAVPPGLFDVVREVMDQTYTNVVHRRTEHELPADLMSQLDSLPDWPSTLSDQLPLSPAAVNRLASGVKLRTLGDDGGVRKIRELRLHQGGQFVAAGGSVRERAKAVAGLLRLVRKGPAAVIAGSGREAKEYADALKRLFPDGSDRRIYANPVAANCLPDGDDGRNDDSGEGKFVAFGDGDVAVVATGISDGVPEHPTLVVFVDSDLAAAEHRLDGDDTLRAGLGVPNEERENVVDYPGHLLPVWRGNGVLPVGVLSPEQLDDRADVRLFRAATRGPILGRIRPPAPAAP
ncbi:hypothetical protein [Alienimonas sp. DA493]|uniref:hypothetical protein n=1 Tax=Alienimonas sp. DA493 TaxID=3373605 RepID=UPI003753F249